MNLKSFIILDQLDKFFKTFVFLCMFIGSFVQAHPVIYEDGFVYWGKFSNLENTQILSYTFHPRFALKLSSDFKKKTNYQDYQLGINTLIQRWLLEDSQANIYASLSGGFFTNEISEIYPNNRRVKVLKLSDKLVFQGNLSADWESRKIYTAGTIMLRGFSNKDLFGRFNYRIGFAPYVAGMDTLQTWFVVMFQLSAKRWVGEDVHDIFLKYQEQGIKDPNYSTIKVMDKSVLGLNLTITPLLRFFYKNILWEMGSNLQSDFYLTLMVHY